MNGVICRVKEYISVTIISLSIHVNNGKNSIRYLNIDQQETTTLADDVIKNLIPQFPVYKCTATAAI